MNKKIIFIKDDLDDYEQIFSLKTINWKIELYLLDQITNEHRNTKFQKENQLIIINHEFYKNRNKDINNILESNLHLTNPYYLLLSESHKVFDDIYGSNIFLYKLYKLDSEYLNDYLINITNYIKLIFDQIEAKERLNCYIVDSFSNIIDNEIIQSQKLQIEELNKEITELNKIDFLTNLLNRKAFFEAFEVEKKRTLRDLWRINNEITSTDYKRRIHDNPTGNLVDHIGRMSCLLLDIDFFKHINDTYGHLCGDEVLQKLGDLLKSSKIFRDNDIIGRYGGEEFIIILVETNYINSKIPANRLRETFKSIIFASEKGETFQVTLSIGISEFKFSDSNNTEVIKRADEALYKAKNNGRDQIVVYEEYNQ